VLSSALAEIKFRSECASVTRMRASRASLGLFPLLVAFLSPLPSPGQEAAAPPNPFAGFETFFLQNGLKVWYKRLPDHPIVSISVAVPFGSDQDPPGKEQLAHFLEHMLFSEHLGRTEEQIRNEIKDRGGEENGYTGSDRTFYFARIGKEHGLFALEWLYRIVSPHGMDPGVVDRQREPVALEVGARPREFFDWLAAYYVDPPWLRLPDFWEREFGIETHNRVRDYYPQRSLSRITSAELRWFYDTYYVPSLMTLTVIGDLERDAVLKQVRQTFATLPARPEPSVGGRLRDPGRFHREVHWFTRPNVFYENGFKFYRPTAQQDVMLIFLSRFLSERLNAKLRFGQRKATYGVGLNVTRRGSGAYFSIAGGLKKEEFEFARNAIEHELEALRTGGLSAADFEKERAAVARRLCVQNTAARDLEGWVWSTFYNPWRHRHFPDLVAAIEKVGKGEAESFVRQHFVPRRQVLIIHYRHPFTQGLQAAGALALLWLTLRMARRLLIRPVDMRRIRYVARFRIPMPYKIVGGVVLLAVTAAGLRLIVFGAQLFDDRFLLGIENFWLRWALYALMLAGIAFSLILVPAHLPYKLLVFEDHLRVKHFAYRSVSLAAADIAEVSRRRLSEVWLSRRLWKCIPLTPGVLSPGIYLRRRDGWAYFFNVRDPEQLMAVLQDFVSTGSERGIRAAEATSAIPGT